MAEQRGGFRGQAADRDALERIEAGGLSFAVEYRHVGQEQGPSVHVFGEVEGSEEEILRFDCFDRTPHYHYGFSYIDQPQVLMDEAAIGDPLEWVCDRIRTRLPAMLRKANAGHLAAACEAERLDVVSRELLARGRELIP